eukprot:5898609-Pleurochrysis_carterae.AAC.4
MLPGRESAGRSPARAKLATIDHCQGAILASLLLPQALPHIRLYHSTPSRAHCSSAQCMSWALLILKWAVATPCSNTAHWIPLGNRSSRSKIFHYMLLLVGLGHLSAEPTYQSMATSHHSTFAVGSSTLEKCFSVRLLAAAS